MAAAAVPNLYNIPLQALRPVTIDGVSSLLNPPKVLPTDDGLPRDWRGLAHLMNLPRHYLPHVSHPDPSGELLKKWTSGSIGLFEEYLQTLDRWDIIEDTKHMMEADAILYIQSLERASTTASNLDANIDNQILTREDVLRLERGLPPQHYNAYLLYAEADETFAVEIIEKMEGKYNLKLCVRDRDLVAGHVFEHEVIMRLISERCNRLIVVISEHFFESEANKFFCTFAQALGIDQKRRKVIPVMHRHCRLPPDLNYYFVLDYTRSGYLWDFWQKLRDSIETPNVPSRCENPHKMVVKEIKQQIKEPKNALVEFKNIKLVNEESVQNKKEKPKDENNHLKKSTSISLENLKAKSKNWFGNISLRAKKNKKNKPLVAV